METIANKMVNKTTKEIMELFPTTQLRPDSAAHVRNKVYALVFKHTAVIRDELRAKIDDLDRRLYIAHKKISDDALEEYVDPAGFNK